MKKNILSLLSLFMTLHAWSQVQFINADWDAARARAKSENKYIFLDAYTDWCVWCKEMDKRTFSLAEVGNMVNEKFVAVKMDMEKGFGAEMAMKYRVSSFPTYLIFNPEGRLVYSFLGFREGSPFLDEIKASLAPERRNGIKGISGKIDLEFPAFYVNSFKGNKSGKVSRADSAEVAGFLNSQKDLFSEVSWSVMTRFLRTQPKYQGFILENKNKFSELYGEQEVNNVLQNIIGSKLNKAIQSKNESAFNETLEMANRYLKDEDGKMKRNYRIIFYKETEQWIKMDKMIMELIASEGYVESLNDYSWTVYEKCNESAVIRDAIGWMKGLTDKNPSYASLDTYAALLYKDRQYELAKKYAEIAIETGKKEEEDVKETEVLLQKINEGIQK